MPSNSGLLVIKACGWHVVYVGCFLSVSHCPPPNLDEQIATVQSLSGTGSLRLGAAFIQRYLPGAKVLISSPTWGENLNLPFLILHHYDSLAWIVFLCLYEIFLHLHIASLFMFPAGDQAITRIL